MFIRRALVLVLAILWLWPASLHAQSEALTEADRQGQARYQAGRYAEAIPHFEKALALAERIKAERVRVEPFHFGPATKQKLAGPSSYDISRTASMK